MKRLSLLFVLCLAVFFVLWAVGCDNGNGGGGVAEEVCPETTLDIAVCDPAAGPFSVDINNEFFPLAVDSKWVLEGEEDDETIRLEITVPGDTEEVAGVTTLVMVETEFEDGELIEVSRNFFAQAPDGTVCYFGEDVEIYEDGEVVSNEGEWRAGENGNLPGIFMPAEPEVGDVFRQEFAPGVAEDQAEVIAFDETIDVPAGIFDHTLTMEDCNPLEDGAKDQKVYVRGIGLAIDEAAELISFQQP
jgi:hypothetical protein